MISRDRLNQYLNDLLQPQAVRDYCPNGLQVEGKHDIKKIVTGVTACQALIDRAIELEADALLVHHGFFWKGESPNVVGPKRERLLALLSHGINLFAYHLPLDIHTALGNNVQLAQKMGWSVSQACMAGGTDDLLWLGKTARPVSLAKFSDEIGQVLHRQPLSIAGGEHSVSKIAWCTGGAQDFIELAHQQGADCYISGEVSERTFHSARELGIHYIAAGHHATERYGVKALGEKLAKAIGVTVQFVDIDNPV